MSFMFGGGNEKTNKTAQTNAINQATAVSTFGLDEAKSTIPKATAALDVPLNFWQKILGGDLSSITKSLQPEIGTVSDQYQAGRKAASEFSGRSGGRAASLEESRFKEAKDTSDLIATARPQAAESVTNIGQILAQLGLGETGVSTSAAGTAGNIATAGRDQAAAQNAQFSQAAGTMASILLGLI